MTPLNLPPLQPGDVLIFSRKGLFDSIIKVKTFSPATHTEMYCGGNSTFASRNGKGVAKYDADFTGLYCVLRPKLPFDFEKARAAFYSTMDGRPYGWLSLFSFVLIDLHDKGLFCSETTTLLLRAGGFEPFKPAIKADVCAPGDFLYVPECVLETIWSASQ